MAICSYSNYDLGQYILVADDNCKSSVSCSVDNTCSPRNITDSPKVTLKDMRLPGNVNVLYFTNVSNLNLTSAKISSWENVTDLELFSCPNLVFSNKINWPPRLFRLYLHNTDHPDKTLVLKNNSLLNIPQSLPPTIKMFRAIQRNALADLNYMPESLTLVYFNKYNKQGLETNDFFVSVEKSNIILTCGAWVAILLKHLPILKYLYEICFTFSNPLLSNCELCKLTNITVDASTYEALNSLKWSSDVWNFEWTFQLDNNTNISTDPDACKAIGGEIKPIFQTQPTLIATACVLSATSNTTTAPTHTGLIIGIVIAVVVVVGIAIVLFICIQRRNKQKQQNEQLPYNSIDDHTYEVHHSKDANNLHLPTHTIETAPSQGSSTNQGTGGQISAHLANSADLDVSLLRQHRLELLDLIVLGNKPLATGAYGELWRGTYGHQQVAIKRMKSCEPRQVQKFIDEIILMSQLDSDCIVKFISASWTRPIEIECLTNHQVNSPWDQKYQSIVSVVRGLVYLHTYKIPIIHRDLKSRNILLDSKKGTKLTDFGTSRVVEENDLMTNGIGTYQYMAPEVIAGTNYSASADIYSFGIVLSEFCTHEAPYAGMRHPQTGKLLTQHYLLNEVREGRLLPSFDGENVPAWVREVAIQCLQLNEGDRPTAMQLSSILIRVKQ
ncbi:kinase [Thraustotheca clavata]|uniref:Kinase n=1 Tax=Thraustotheca clavata TaxID=74557 RepID=A0A1V9Z3N5_9STRA|nr:kinase [Thraustotheca clavata]